MIQSGLSQRIAGAFCGSGSDVAFNVSNATSLAGDGNDTPPSSIFLLIVVPSEILEEMEESL